ncbi:MAG: flavin reductase family protein [Ruminococcaceae bacterium]|nr:flavin reductase family protein [Oscillospiraceae bacterium]
MTDPNTLDFNPFEKIGKEWALFGVASEDESNAMTVSWGEVGVLWNKPIFTVFVRPTRYTHTLSEKTDIATLSFFDGNFKKVLSYFGRVSGRDENKLEVSNLEYKVENDALIFEDATLTLVGKKLYFDEIDPKNFCDPELEDNYDNDYHKIYVYEIIEVIKKER